MQPLLILLQFLLIVEPIRVLSVKIIDNGLAPPEIVHQPIDIKPQCIVRAAPLDLIFILDSSGSLKNRFQDEIDVIRRIVRHVTVGTTATRIALIQFSGVQHLEFNFLKFTDRFDVLSALDVLRHVSGITRVGGAFEFVIKQMTTENGLRGAEVPKIAFLLSDGRTHDYPKDREFADELRRRVANLDIWAYGTGDYVAISELVGITKSESKIITNKNLDQLESLFDAWKGTEICEEAPVCIKGSDKPLDLMLLIDSSESVDKMFNEQITFAVERIVQNIHVNPDAVRMALITYSGQAFVQFAFNDPRFNNNSAIIRHLNDLKSIKGTTSTHLALYEATELFDNRNGNSGVRQGVKRLAIILTDGHSQRSPRAMAKRLANEGVEIFAISMSPRPYVDEAELLTIAGDERHVFIPSNLHEFETQFLKYVGFGCVGIELGPQAQPRVRGATDVTCGTNHLTLTVRTQKPMSGLMYAQQYHDDSKCVQVTDGSNRQVSITFFEGTCGLVKTASVNRDGYFWNLTVILQFHPLIVTRADQGLDVNCFFATSISQADIGRSTIKKIGDTQCSYRLHRFSPDECVALDAKVGESLYHKWECDSPANYQYLVHDCYVQSERRNVAFIDSNGCQIDAHFLETPIYTSMTSSPRKGDAYVYQEMSVFKFPGEDNVTFRCKISLCDMEGIAPCTRLIPPKCDGRNVVDPIRDGFSLTIDVETRTLNVLLNEAIKPPVPIKYCDIRL